MADRAGSTDLADLQLMPKTGAGHHLREIVAFGTQRIGSVDADVGVRERIRDVPTRRYRLAHLVAALENMRPLRAVRTVWSVTAKLAIIVAVVAVRTKDPRSHVPSGSDSVRLQHLGSEARLGNTLVRSCVTGWLEVVAAANWEMMFSGSRSETTRRAWYPKFTVVFPLPWLVP